MATKAITVRVEYAVKKQAEAMLEEMGLDMSTYIIASVKALVREKKIPFSMVTAQYITERVPYERLAIAMAEESAPEKHEAAQNTAEGIAVEKPAAAESEVDGVDLEDEAYIAESESFESLTTDEPEKAEPAHWVAAGYTPDKIILEKLAGAEQEAGDPSTRLLSHSEVFSKIRERHLYEI